VTTLETPTTAVQVDPAAIDAATTTAPAAVDRAPAALTGARSAPVLAFTAGGPGGPDYAAAESVQELRGGIKLVQLHDDLARVTLSSGEVLGYVERFIDPRGERFRAKRFMSRQRRFVEIGEFWSRADATDCFRFA